jgi:peptidylprolyl isomerase
MAKPKKGDTVRVHYTGRLADGSVFDSSAGRDPLQFKVGAGQVIAGFDEAVAGLNPGEKTTVEISVERAYGARRENLVTRVPRAQVPPNIHPEVGQRLQVQPNPGGQRINVTITEVTDEAITLDANHPLAGKELIFDIELVEIV